jgi:two-component system, NarL family, nitrate/nitrite response regulator NarL
MPHGNWEPDGRTSESSKLPIRVLIIADIRLFSEGLQLLLAEEDEMAVLGCASTLDDGVPLIHELGPDIVLLHESRVGGIRDIRALLASTPWVRVIALAVPESEAEVVHYAEAGVAGCVTQDAGRHHLLAGIASVARGEGAYTPRMVASLLRRVAMAASEQRPVSVSLRLTSRELEIVGLIGEGLSNKEIARHLSIQLSTVKNHVHNLLEKLGVRRRTEAAALIAQSILPERSPMAG